MQKSTSENDGKGEGKKAPETGISNKKREKVCIYANFFVPLRRNLK